MYDVMNPVSNYENFIDLNLYNEFFIRNKNFNTILSRIKTHQICSYITLIINNFLFITLISIFFNIVT